MGAHLHLHSLFLHWGSILWLPTDHGQTKPSANCPRWGNADRKGNPGFAEGSRACWRNSRHSHAAANPPERCASGSKHCKGQQGISTEMTRYQHQWVWVNLPTEKTPSRPPKELSQSLCSVPPTSTPHGVIVEQEILLSP